MSPTLSVVPAVQLVMMGVVAYTGVHHLLLWAGRREEPLHLWVSAWCGDTLLYLAGHHIQVSFGLEWATLGARFAWVSAMVLVPVMVGLIHRLAGRTPPRGVMVAAVSASAVVAAAAVFTDLVVTGRAYVRSDLLGRAYTAPVLGPRCRTSRSPASTASWLCGGPGASHPRPTGPSWPASPFTASAPSTTCCRSQG